MATVANKRKIVIGARMLSKDGSGNSEYLARRRIEIAEFRFLCALLIRWGRGFSLEDAPPHLNEWTRTPRV